MEKIKNILHPGRAEENEQLYGTGSTGNTGGLTGERSHLASSKDHASGLAGSRTTGTSGIGNGGTGFPSEATSDQAGHAIDDNTGTGLGHSADTSSLAGQGSHLAGGTTFGLTGNQTSGLGNTTSTGPNPLARDAAVTAAQTTPGNTGFSHHGGSVAQHGSGRELATETTTPAVKGQAGIPSGTTTIASTHMPGSWDDSYDRNTPGLTGSNPLDSISGVGSTAISSTTQNQLGSTGFSGSNTSGLGSGTGSTTSPGATGQLGSTTGSSGLSHGTNTSSGHHLGRDAAALGTAGAIGEGIHHRQQNQSDVASSTDNAGFTSQTGSGHGVATVFPTVTAHSTKLASGSEVPSTTTSSGYSSTLPDRTGGSQQPGYSSGTGTSSGHHLGRDAAVLGTAGAVGAGIHHHNQQEQEYTGTNRTIPLSGGSTTATPGYKTTGSTSRPHTTTTANLLDPSVSGRSGKLEDAHVHDPRHGGGAEAADEHHGASTTGSSGHHLGRDAAIGVGGVGATGLAAHEHNKHHNERSTGLGNTSDLSQSTAGNSRTDPALTGTTSKDHHYGRDAAIGAGGVGAAGPAGREYEKHHGDNTTGTSSTSGLTQSTPTTVALPGPAPNTAGPHSKDWMNKLDPRVIANPTVAQGNPQAANVLSSQKPSAETGGYGVASGSDHHYGRDAAIAGGVGTAAYESEKNHSGKHDTQNTSQRGNPSSSTVTGTPYSNTHAPNDNTARSTTDKDHHYARDAAIAGGVGGAAYEAEKHHKHDKDLTEAEREAEKQQKHDEKELKKEQRHDESELKKEQKHDEKRRGSKGLLGFLHRDKNKKYTPEEEAEFDRQELEHNSHAGRDTALGAAGVGALGAGAYQAEKHHDQHTDTNKPLPYAPGNQGVGTGAGIQNYLAGGTTSTDHHGPAPLAEKPIGTDLGDKLHGAERNRGVPGSSGVLGSDGYAAGKTGTDHHLGRDAALGAGAVGVAGYAAHEHEKRGPIPLAEKPIGKDLGDHLHGVEGNRGVPGSSGVPSTKGYAAGTTTGTGSEGHHLGRDVALGAGAAGVAGLGAHEYRKHDASSSGLSGSQGYGTNAPTNVHSEASIDQYGKPLDSGVPAASDGHSLVSDGTLPVGVGAAGVGVHEHRKHDSGYQHGYDKTTNSGPTGSQQRSNLTGLSGQQNDTSSSLTGSKDHHYGRDAAAVGGAGALAEHEHRKHEGVGHHTSSTGRYYNTSSALTGSEYRKKDTTSGLTSSTNSYDNTGLGYGQQQSDHTSLDSSHKSSGLDPNVVEGSDGRHRLHKDPPAGHPTSGGSHVPSSGSETQKLMQEGKEGLDGNTGVANSRDENKNY